jgi:hypothetical protein
MSTLRMKAGSADKLPVPGFAEQAQHILDAAVAAVARGEGCLELTILIGLDGGIEMVTDSDWALQPLAVERAARTAYRVSRFRDSVRVEGYEHSRTCILEAKLPTERRLYRCEFRRP